MADFQGTIGIGNYKYAVVWCKTDNDFWDFIPLADLTSETLKMSFREFCVSWCPEADFVNLVMYSDNHTSLVKLCSDFGIRHRHPPPGRPQANAVATTHGYGSYAW